MTHPYYCNQTVKCNAFLQGALVGLFTQTHASQVVSISPITPLSLIHAHTETPIVFFLMCTTHPVSKPSPLCTLPLSFAFILPLWSVRRWIFQTLPFYFFPLLSAFYYHLFFLSPVFTLSLLFFSSLTFHPCTAFFYLRTCPYFNTSPLLLPLLSLIYPPLIPGLKHTSPLKFILGVLPSLWGIPVK